jgi:N-acetylneuraminic acid mutarotase
MREGFSFTQIGSKCFLFGGISSKKYNDVAEYDLEREAWKKIETSGEKPSARNNHSAVAFKKLLYVFGGEKLYDEHTHTRECMSEFRVLNTDTMEWKTVKTNGDGIEGRRGHASVLVGKNMLILGGINTKGYYLDTLYHLDLCKEKRDLSFSYFKAILKLSKA